ncbi:MAG: AAA family ATPase [Bacteroidales bacterium]|nr:AAA family ATPase [Bacteroidales bacterium]
MQKSVILANDQKDNNIMIAKIKLHKTASYNDLVEFEPKEINYFFGGNGVGKSSMGKVIYNVSAYPHCELSWRNSPIEVLTYNKQFVKSSFSHSNQIQGIFTLGKDATEVQSFIEELWGLKRNVQLIIYIFACFS